MRRTTAGNQDFLKYIEEILRDTSDQLEEAVKRSTELRQYRRYADDDLKADLSHLKMLVSDVQRSRGEVCQFYSHREGWDTSISAESVALLDTATVVENKAKRLIANLEADLYKMKKEILRAMLDEMEHKMEIKLNAMLNDYKYHI